MKRLKLDENECIICEEIIALNNPYRPKCLNSINTEYIFKNAIITDNKTIDSMNYDEIKLYYELLPHQELEFIHLYPYFKLSKDGVKFVKGWYHLCKKEKPYLINRYNDEEMNKNLKYVDLIIKEND